MVVGQRFATAMAMPSEEYINVIFPFEFSGIPDEIKELLNLQTNLEFSPNRAFCVQLLDGIFYSAVGSNVFDDVDVLVHEYGHFVENVMGIYGANQLENIQYGLEHNLSEDKFTNGYPKKCMMELVWSESWANAFSQIAQNCYMGDGKGMPEYADCKYDGYTFETLNPGNGSGEAQEAMVTAFLRDLFDTETTANSKVESNDNISLGYQYWWNYTTRSGTYTLSDFTSNVDKYYYNYRSQIGELLSAHQIAPGNVSVVNPYSITSTVAPRVTWKVNGSQSNPNNMFEIYFYDAYGNYIYKTGKIYTSVGYDKFVTYVIPSDVWAKVGAKFNGTFYINVVVRGYNTTEFSSGTYMSAYKKCLVTNNTSINIPASSRYTEKKITLDKGGVFTYTVNFATSGYKLIQTFGNIDTKIEICSSSGTVLASNDDGGYGTNALSRYYFSAGTTYKIKVKFYSASSAGSTKLAITATNGVYTSSNMSMYEGISSITGKTSYTGTLTSQPNYTKVMTFTPPSSGTYTFEIQSNNDMYIYVIDPRLSSALTSTSYNDDSGTDWNPLLTKSLTAGVPYLIICCPYNPSSLSSTIGYSLKINKK